MIVTPTTSMASAIAFDATQMWIADDLEVERAPADGGTAVDVTHAEDGWGINAVAVADEHVYFGAGGGAVRVCK